MNDDEESSQRLLAALPVPALPPALRQRTLALARAQLAAPPARAPLPLRQVLPSYATSAALLSADVVFVADACLKIGRAFGG
jgi:hypothetical protein